MFEGVDAIQGICLINFSQTYIPSLVEKKKHKFKTVNHLLQSGE